MNDLFARHLELLDQTERMPPADLAHYQEDLLTALVRHARDNTAFYADRLSCLFDSRGEVDLSRWNDVPILDRDDVIARGRDMRADRVPPELGKIGEIHTSGSTGTPLDIAVNGMVLASSNALLTRMAKWFGLDVSRPMAAIRRAENDPVPPYPDGATRKGWSFADLQAPYYILELKTPVHQQIEWLARKKAPYLIAPASGALGIAHAVTPASGRALGIEMVISIGETIPEGTREFVAERLGARFAGMYACQEVGAIACECEFVPHYHVAAENVLVEIVDDHGRDVRHGERGRVVLTGLYNFAMPFIRYAIGDVAVAGGRQCPCGRTLPIIETVLGRTRNMFVFRDGSRIWPRASMVRPMHAFVPFKRYQLVQLDFEKIEFRYEPDGSGRKADLAGLNDYARRALHPSVEITMLAVEELTPGPGGKLEEFVSHVADTATAGQL
jgi:phenylacetate-CoA ligase